MKRLVVGIVAATVLASMAQTAAAQSKTVTSEMKVQAGTVEAIDPERRMVTLKKADGTFVTIVAGPDITRFSEVKVGDTVTARYYENLVVRLKHPGESEVDSKVKSTTPSYQELPGGTKATQRTITATITAIDPATPSITFTGPNGWIYTSRVQDPTTLTKVKVGDKVDIVWTEALMVALDR